MVERPIKKSERQAAANSEATEVQVPSEVQQSKPKPTPRSERAERSSERGNDRGSERGNDRGSERKGRDDRKGKGKDSRRDEPQSRVSPALMRGPRPTQPRVVETPPEATAEPQEATDETETSTEASSDEAAEATEA